jgi:hypothetical protein
VNRFVVEVEYSRQMLHLFRRHERFDKAAAGNPELQLKLETERQAARDFALDCVEFIEGRQTPGAERAKAEHDRLLKQNKEARRRALCGADPLNLTGINPAKPMRKVLAADPVERVGKYRPDTAVSQTPSRQKQARPTSTHDGSGDLSGCL